MVDMEHWHIVLPIPSLGLSESIRHIVGGSVAVCLKFIKPKQVQVLVLVVIEQIGQQLIRSWFVLCCGIANEQHRCKLFHFDCTILL